MLTSVVKGAKKKWWALLHTQSGTGGRFLYLFSKQGDKKEREKVRMAGAGSRCIEIISPTFTHTSAP